MNPPSRLQNFPISWFATVMGLSGLTIAWEKAEAVFSLPVTVSPALAGLTATVFLAVALLYAAKTFRHPEAVTGELRHPVKLSFFPTISISLILLAICTYHLAPAWSLALWAGGTALHLVFTLFVMAVWLNHEHFEIHHMNPAWFIPVVGNILVPIAGTAHGYAEISWFFFSVGLVFWLVLLTIVFYRMIFHQPLPAKLTPTLFILIAPPAVGFLSYFRLTGEIDAFARILYYSGLFLTLMLTTQIGRFARIRFFLSWWAYSFPLAAITVATLVMGQALGGLAFQVLGVVLLTVLSLVLAMLVVRTALSVGRREICVEEE
ncbi:MAG TPA: SLAC1 anion channel family protein [Gammaproteobacteria bacterium]|nr:SLAC1 anion channel family protein [Gammaproteobacteria bacterium]